MSELSERIKEAVERSGKTHRRLAEEIGVTEVSFSRYMNGTRIPKAPIAEMIAKACGVSVGWLLTGQKELREKVEMIISYTTDGTDYQYNDNHGILIRCKDCAFNGGNHRRCMRENGMYDIIGELDYCSKAVKREAI